MSLTEKITDEQIRAAWKKTGAIKPFGQAMGCSRGTARKLLDRCGIERQKPGRTPTHDFTNDQIQLAMSIDGTRRSAAESLGCHPRTLGEIIKKKRQEMYQDL